MSLFWKTVWNINYPIKTTNQFSIHTPEPMHKTDVGAGTGEAGISSSQAREDCHASMFLLPSEGNK